MDIGELKPLRMDPARGDKGKYFLCIFASSMILLSPLEKDEYIRSL